MNAMHKKAIMNTMMKGGENVVSPEKQPPKLSATGKSSSFKLKKSNEWKKKQKLQKQKKMEIKFFFLRGVENMNYKLI